VSGFGKNIASIRVQRLLNNASDGVARAAERLGSGLRINRASDDAAGLAVSSSLNSKSRVYTAAIKNANDGVSALSIADAAAGELTTIVTRLKELAEAAANGTFSLNQRRSIDTEAKALTDEYNRIIQATEFNGRKLFDGSSSSIALQLGYGTSESLSVGLSTGLQNAVNNGTFGTARSSVTLWSNVKMGLADFNSDGRTDVVVADNTNILNGRAYVVNAASAGALGSIAATLTETSTISNIAAGDLNGDGRADVLAANGSRVTYYAGNGNGTFQGGKRLTAAGTVGGVALGDINGDGITDMVSTQGTNVVAHFGFQEGTQLSFTSSVSTAVGHAYSAVEISDFDGDGKADLYLGSGTQFTKALGAGNGAFSAQTATVIAGTRFDIGDVNRDGIDDIAIASSLGALLYRGNADGSTQASTLVSSGNPLSDVALADLNEDGYLDIAGVTDTDPTNIVTHFANSDGTFQHSQTSATSAQSGGLIGVGDFNGDGVSDAAVLDGQIGSGPLASYMGASTTTTALTRVDLTSRQDALTSIAILDTALARILNERSIIGSAQSRLHSAVNTITASRENYITASSRIRDADIASESAELVKRQIVQQSAANILAQANLLPARALALLRI